MIFVNIINKMNINDYLCKKKLLEVFVILLRKLLKKINWSKILYEVGSGQI